MHVFPGTELYSLLQFSALTVTLIGLDPTDKFLLPVAPLANVALLVSATVALTVVELVVYGTVAV